MYLFSKQVCVEAELISKWEYVQQTSFGIQWEGNTEMAFDSIFIEKLNLNISPEAILVGVWVWKGF